ncbi:hypothetical protein [Haloarcula salinisoli]|uniref:Uncharacterized protein n=1 Tax=Haloarcula salinisoli TaxID=2487746 RepID=A0A8J7YAF6_9EURY|nr:hypothetical protein [Halomicroarcula salinisoli]MBX0286067.1 hypothetical protein [Halomicroarcula salinisoli]MBX0302445.1 hypothetical protein [Halomicroarcula salinisoli]
MMDCICCGRPAGYNRAVVDVLSGRELAGFCRNCELDEFGRTLERFTGTGSQCTVCNRDGHIALAAWQPSVERSASKLVSRVTYEVTDRTPTLCDEHIHQIADGPLDAPGRASR